MSCCAIHRATTCPSERRYLHESNPPVVAQLNGKRILVDGNFTAKIRVELHLKDAQGRPVYSDALDEWCAGRSEERNPPGDSLRDHATSSRGRARRLEK